MTYRILPTEEYYRFERLMEEIGQGAAAVRQGGFGLRRVTYEFLSRFSDWVLPVRGCAEGVSMFRWIVVLIVGAALVVGSAIGLSACFRMVSSGNDTQGLVGLLGVGGIVLVCCVYFSLCVKEVVNALRK